MRLSPRCKFGTRAGVVKGKYRKIAIDGRSDDQMRRYLSCDKRGEDGKYIGWIGRSDGYGNPSHSVIHGRLFEQGALELRKKVAQANEALLRDERIRDLEDQVKSLVEQLNKANAENERLRDRLHAFT